MKSFNVIWWDFNNSYPEPYDVIPYLVIRYKESKNKPTTFEEFKEFIRKESLSRWWSRCEYEIIIKKWPPSEDSKKIDIHSQIIMNIDIVTEILMESVKE